MTWLGRKKIAFVPVYRPNAKPPDFIPPDWEGQIMRRIFFDPDPAIFADRSLRAYIHKVSSGRADFDAVVMPRVIIDQQDVKPADFDQQLGGPQLRAQGFDAAAIVMLGGFGAGTNEGFWSRFVMLERLGTWAMEPMHGLCGFPDLRSLPNAYDDSPNDEGDIGNFDEMSINGGMHPTAYTKRAIGWLDASAVAQHTGRKVIYDLHAVGLVQPPPFGRSTAVQIGVDVPYLMVEARLMVDQFESPSQLEPGIPTQGVIVYRVQTSDPLGNPQNRKIPLFLLTPSALAVGQSFTSDTNVTVTVMASIPGGLTVSVDDRSAAVESGQLLFYRDYTLNGTGDVNTPSVIGLGGWQQFLQLFSGGDGSIYALNNDDQLLFYRDYTRDGTGDVNTPSVIDQGGWKALTRMFPGGNGIIYAVNAAGELLFYRDNSRDGTPAVSGPARIGLGGWQQFHHLFCGGDGIIYAVNDDDQLLFYRDFTQDGTGDVNTPSIIDQGGWKALTRMFSGGDGIIYAVDGAGRLIFYRDNSRDGTPAVSGPYVIGQGGWQSMKFLFGDGQGIIYAVPV